MKHLSPVKKFWTLPVVGLGCLFSLSPLHGHDAKQNEQHGILQVFTPSYSKWNPHTEMHQWEHHDIEIFTEAGERIRGWWHRKPIRLRPGKYLVSVPGMDSQPLPVAVGAAKTNHLVIESTGRGRVKVLE